MSKVRVFRTILCVLTVLALFVSCDKRNRDKDNQAAVDELVEEIETSQSLLPMEVPTGRFIDIDYDTDNDVVTFVFELDDLGLGDDVLNANLAGLKERTDLLVRTKSMAPLIRKIVDAEARLTFTVGTNDGQSKSVTYTISDLEQALDNPLEDNEARRLGFAVEVKRIKPVLPVEIEDGLYLKDVDFVDSDNEAEFVYETIFTEDNGFIYMNNSTLKSACKMLFTDPQIRGAMNILGQSGINARFSFVDSVTGKKLSCLYTTDELLEFGSMNVDEAEVEYEIFKNSVDEIAQQLPERLDRGMYLVDSRCVDHDYIRTIRLDEDIYDMDALSGLKSDLYQEIIDEARQDPDVAQLYRDCLRNVKVIYVGSRTGAKVEVSVPTTQI